MAMIKSSLTVLALLCPLSCTAAAETDERHPAAIAPQGAQLTFHTLDGDTQQVNPDEIWRIRATSTSDEPPGAVVIHRLRAGLRQRQSRQRGRGGGRRTAFKEIYPANRSASLHRCRQGDRRHPPDPAAVSPECPCDHRLARRPDPGSAVITPGNALLHSTPFVLKKNKAK